MRSHVVDQVDNYSLVISAEKSNAFLGKVNYKGLPEVPVGEQKREWTDEKGGQHSDSRTRVQKFAASFQLSEEITRETDQSFKKVRHLEAKFVNGQLEQMDSKLLPADEVVSASADETIPLDPIQVAPDTFITLRIYELPTKQLTVRAKLEYPADKKGLRFVQHSEGIYDKVPEHQPQPQNRQPRRSR